MQRASVAALVRASAQRQPEAAPWPAPWLVPWAVVVALELEQASALLVLLRALQA
jgi:hypothetical protein